MSTKLICPECIKKQEDIYRLREENKRLKDKLRIQERKISEGPFGSSTPSSKKPVKPNTTSKKKNGGAKKGHKGHGRKVFDRDQADIIETIESETLCPDCHIELHIKDRRERYVIDFRPSQVKKIIYGLPRKQCKKCGRIYQSKPPGVLPKYLYGNKLISHIAIEHYLKGKTLGALEKELDVGYGVLIKILHNLANIFKSIPDKLIEEYRQAPVKHADETGWRNDGNNGYAWLFATKDLSIFRFSPSRAGKIAQDVFGHQQIPGVLVVDRYRGYNKIQSDKQYCYAHLFRKIKDLEKEFPDNEEIASFIEETLPLLAEAMNLRSLPIGDAEFYRRAKKTKTTIIKAMNKQARHAAIQNIQTIFRENEDKLCFIIKMSTFRF